jgi:DNA-binding transcriptional ArsR family regulator
VEVEKGTPLRLQLEEREEREEWETLDEERAFRVSEALADPLRRWIYRELGKGPLRQAELARRASEALGRKITSVLMRYHLNKLSSAGLVRFESEGTPPRRAKKVYRNLEVRIQARPFYPPPGGLEGELSGALRRAREVR